MKEPEYADSAGHVVSLDKLCRVEPAWAANRLRAELKNTTTLAAKVEELERRLREAEDNLEADHQRENEESESCWKTLCEIRCIYYDDPKASDGACPSDLPEMVEVVRDWMKDLRTQLVARDREVEGLREAGKDLRSLALAGQDFYAWWLKDHPDQGSPKRVRDHCIKVLNKWDALAARGGEGE